MTSRRVVLHVGAPKSGTTFLQEALWLHRDALLEQGFRSPGRLQRDMFLAAVDVRRTHLQWGLQREQVEGRWQELCQEAREFPGTTIMSHELLGAASAGQITNALAELDGMEIDVVFTARDLTRQVVSEWQERIKNGSTAPFLDFQRVLSKQLLSGELRGLFWRNQDLPRVLDRWARHLPPRSVHVVTSPPADQADPRELWSRFAEAVGFNPAGLDPDSPTIKNNPSLGVTQIAILRQVNSALAGRIPQPAYTRVVKRYLGQDLLALHRSRRPTTPPALTTDLRELSKQWIDQITERGYCVHGDLADLMSPETMIHTGSPDSPDDVDLAEQCAVSTAVIADLLVETARLRAEIDELVQRPPVTLPARVRRRLRRLLDDARRR
jgi:hypothetical protein